MVSTSVRPETDRAAEGGARVGRDAAPSRLRGGPRRSVPHLSLGVLLVVACATGFAIVSTQLDDREPVLALAEPVTVGQVLTPADLREVRVAADTDVGTIPSSQAGTVVGATMAISLPAGSLLSRVMLGDALLPEPGEAIAAVALPQGRFPPEVSPGSHVIVTPAPDGPGDAAAADGAPTGWPAMVVGVHLTASESTTVISLQLDEDDARKVAAAGPVSVVMISQRGR